MLILPEVKTKPDKCKIKFAIFAGKPKAGKSSLMASLDSNLIIDLEDGYTALEAMTVRANSVQDCADIANAVREKMANNDGKFPYKYITIDNATRLEEICLPYAGTLYKQSPTGKNYTGTDVRLLPNGIGYMYVRQAVRKVIDIFKDLCETLILITHTKDRTINVDGEELYEIAIDLSGKLGDILCGEADVIGYVYRRKNETLISFEGGDNIIREARPLHLRGKKIVVAESDENNNITFHMDRIFLPD